MTETFSPTDARKHLEIIPVKWDQSVFRLSCRRVCAAMTVVAMSSMIACKTEEPEAPSAKSENTASESVRTQQGSEAVPQSASPASVPKDVQVLVGRWGRTDGSYVIEIQTAQDDGTLEAAYYNPGPIHVARAETADKDHGLEVFIELRDVNYPGSTYTLVYDREKDKLFGIYYQAVARQNFEVEFVRQ